MAVKVVKTTNNLCLQNVWVGVFEGEVTDRKTPKKTKHNWTEIGLMLPFTAASSSVTWNTARRSVAILADSSAVTEYYRGIKMNVKFTSMLTGQMQDITMHSISWVSMQHASCNHDRLEHALEIKIGYMYCILIIHAVISNNFFVTLQKWFILISVD